MSPSRWICALCWSVFCTLGLLLAAPLAMADGMPRGSYGAQPFSWTGFYVGANVGGAWSDVTITDRDAFAATATPGTQTKVRSQGWVGGGQAGYNLQTGPLVLGIEIDYGFMDVGRSRLLTGTASNTRVGEDSGGYGDITGRLGFAAGRTLFYAKGGWAFFDGRERFSTQSAGFTVGQNTGTFNGWTLGGGVEHMLDLSWSVKLEYQHFDFGTEHFALTPGTFRFRDELNADTVKIGLNYKFGVREEYRPLK